MTYRRHPDSWSAGITAAVKMLGAARAAEAAGVSESRLRQLANPCRNDANAIETLFRLDLAAALETGAAPLFELWREKLIESGALRLARAERRAGCLSSAMRAAIATLRSLADALETALAPIPALIPVRARA